MIGDGVHARAMRRFCAADADIVAIGDNRRRKKAVEAAGPHSYCTLVHPSAQIAGAEIGAGTVIFEGALVQAGVKIGRHCIINAGAVVCHDCVLEDYVHIAPGAALCGNVHVGEGTLVGVGVGIAPNTVIPPWSLVKARRLEICPL